MTTPDPAVLMATIRDKSSLIVRQQAAADAGRFKDIGAALGLQHLRKERAALQAKLPPLRLASLDGQALPAGELVDE